MAQLRRQASDYRQRNARILTITTGTPADTAEFCRRHDVPFTCMVDRPGEPAYRAFGLEKVGLLRLFGPDPLVSLATLVKRWREVRNPRSGDVYQLSGTFVVDGNGVLRFVHRSRYPNDQAGSEQVWACLDALPAAAG